MKMTQFSTSLWNSKYLNHISSLFKFSYKVISMWVFYLIIPHLTDRHLTDRLNVWYISKNKHLTDILFFLIFHPFNDQISTGCPEKNAPMFLLSFSSYKHAGKVGSIASKTFLYDIWEPRSGWYFFLASCEPR